MAPLAFLPVDDVHQEAPVDGIKALGGFIQDQQLGIIHDGDAQLNFLLLAARQFVQLYACLVRQGDPLEVLQRPGFGSVPVHALEPAEVGHDVDDLFLLVQAALLREVAEPAPVLGPEWLAVYVQGSCGGLVDAQEGPDGGGFARPVAAQEAERLAPLHVEGQIADDSLVPEIHPELIDMDECFAHGCSPKCR